MRGGEETGGKGGRERQIEKKEKKNTRGASPDAVCPRPAPRAPHSQHPCLLPRNHRWMQVQNHCRACPVCKAGIDEDRVR